MLYYSSLQMLLGSFELRQWDNQTRASEDKSFQQQLVNADKLFIQARSEDSEFVKFQSDWSCGAL